MEQRSAIPWCDRRRTYCASGCSVRDSVSNSGACDWEAKIKVVQFVGRPDFEAAPRQPPPPPQARQQPGRPAQQQHPRSKFGRGRHHPGRRYDEDRQGSGHPSAAAGVAAAQVRDEAVPEAAQPEVRLVPESSSE